MLYQQNLATPILISSSKSSKSYPDCDLQNLSFKALLIKSYGTPESTFEAMTRGRKSKAAIKM
jgi:hypothetical protein